MDVDILSDVWQSEGTVELKQYIKLLSVIDQSNKLVRGAVI